MARAFIYCENANTAAADALLARHGISAQSYASIQAGITEYSFDANDELIERVATEVFNGSAPVFFSRQKLPIAGNVGTVTVTPGAPSTVLAGTASVTGSAAAITGTSATSANITLQADHDNTDYILVGNGTTQSIRLEPSQSVDLAIDNPTKIFARSNSGTQTLRWMGS